MTDELKTVKDLKHMVEREEGTPDYEAVDLLALKAEAVKWVKFTLDYKRLEKNFPDIKQRAEQQRMNDGARLFIKHFFNITDEELKNE